VLLLEEIPTFIVKIDFFLVYIMRECVHVCVREREVRRKIERVC